MIHPLVGLLLMVPPQAPAQPAAPPAVVWQVTAPSPLILAQGRAAPVLVTVLADSVTRPRIVHSTLREAGTGALLLGEQVTLCLRPQSGCTTPASLAKGSHQIYMMVSDSFDKRGEFKGSLYLQVNEKPEPTPVELTVYGSGRGNQATGVGLILVGVLLSIFLTAFLRQSSSRLDALAPAAALAGVLDELDLRVEKTSSVIGFGFTKTRGRTAQLRRELSEATLDGLGYLPRRLRNPFGGDPDATAYRAYLTERSAQIAAVAVVVRRGLDAVDDAWKPPAGHPAIVTAVKALDDLAATTKVPAEATVAVEAIIGTMHGAMAPPGAAGMAQAAAAPRPIIRSVMEIRSQQTRIALAAWALLAIVTVVAGFAILILSNHGFGTPLDYVKCFFWGLGVQAAGQQVQQLTPGGIATSLKLSLPA